MKPAGIGYLYILALRKGPVLDPFFVINVVLNIQMPFCLLPFVELLCSSVIGYFGVGHIWPNVCLRGYRSPVLITMAERIYLASG
jgi:hypothetical protein